MVKQKRLILGIMALAIVIVAILISDYVATGEKYTLTDNPVIINKDVSGAPSTPIDLVLIVRQFSEDKTSEITIKVGKRAGYKAEWFEARNTSITLHLPEGLKIVDCPTPRCELGTWKGDIIGDQVKELKVKVKAVKNGELSLIHI